VEYEINAGGRARHVTVSRIGDDFAVSVDGRLRRVDVARVDAHTLSLIVDRSTPADPHDLTTSPQDPRGSSGPGSVYEATIVADTDGGLVVLVGSVPVEVRQNGRLRGARRQARGGAASGPLRIVAPMPGKVVRVLVKAGDAVHARQPVVVVEAMKMENELRADRDGTVAEIHTREGMSVDAGALLIVIQ